MIFKRFALLSIGIIASILTAEAQQKSYIQSLDEPNAWVDSVFNKMSRRQKIAQLFFVRAHTNKGAAYADSVGKLIRKERIGGIVFFQGGPGRQAELSNRYQKLSRVPLLVASDGEWGLGMRLDSTISYPYQMTLGAVQDNQLLYQMGRQVAADFKRVGMQMNFAPDADINNNPKNPIINYRSFGENKYNVAEKAGAYMKGMQDGGLLVTLKHFPGHGDTDVDSHYDLPQLKFSKARLDSLELFPFERLIQEGAAGIMVAHMNIPALDPTPNLPSTLSRPIVTGLLKQGMSFKGLVVTDAMEMKGVVKNYKDGEADVLAVIAGNDIIELSENSERAVRLVRKAVREERIPIEQIDSSVKKILYAKYWAGLNRQDTVSTTGVYADVNRPESKMLIKKLAESSITVLNSSSPIKALSPQKRTVILSIGTSGITTFQRELGTFYKNAVYFTLDKNAGAAAVAKISRELDRFEQVIIGIHDTRTRPGNGMVLSADLKTLIKNQAARQSIFALFANPYNLSGLPGIEKSKSLIVAYQKEDFMQQAAAAVLSNKVIATGKLPVTVSPSFPYGAGM
ncbi:glycoside hydrolase family 3 [Pedobacter antarcticus 4BY]|uniref:beta-N-acetylhexosaminidase n=2 Tax=Pedobacter antarcticus TaxID=34086 RepID=A0A081PJE6_9SPHI|nr:glycoside hydrolase family 3 N-terminal domain-containing protein [Pedobacter antarcticus]KEQ30819.1 glycoside hydrolase family 3 [Pedobacter antarcticus 4BY]SFE66770.1 beta-glucosidase [Pedobacter antarcticus]